jgi:hypothetical protein
MTEVYTARSQWVSRSQQQQPLASFFSFAATAPDFSVNAHNVVTSATNGAAARLRTRLIDKVGELEALRQQRSVSNKERHRRRRRTRTFRALSRWSLASTLFFCSMHVSFAAVVTSVTNSVAQSACEFSVRQAEQWWPWHTKAARTAGGIVMPPSSGSMIRTMEAAEEEQWEDARAGWISKRAAKGIHQQLLVVG